MAAFIQVDRLAKSYKQGDQQIPVLKEVSLSIEKGDIYGIIGLSGAGKSTLIRCLSRLVIPSSGKVLFEGVDIAGMDKLALRAFRKKMGMIFQHCHLLSSRTVGRNIAYPLEISGVSRAVQEERVDELLELVGLCGKKESYISRLSGGEKQRVSIAQALAHQPSVLFCDEATSSLDPKTTGEILKLLKSLHKKLKLTIVLITHEMDVIKELCNKVAVLDQGKIVETGLVTDVFLEPQHTITQNLIQTKFHDIPAHLLKKSSPHHQLLRLRFRGKAAGEPLISAMVSRYQVHANILLGWIDHVQTVTVGTLVIELMGSPDGIASALSYLAENGIHYEVLET